MRNGLFAAAAFFATAILAGAWAGNQSWNKVVWIDADSFSTGSQRGPAAIRKDLDFSRLNGAELVSASQKRLVTAAEIVLKNDDLGIRLGHFVTRGEDGRRKLACDVYDRISLEFVAEGIADAGTKPTMQVEGSCRTAEEDITKIAPIWIPVQKILAQQPADMDLSYPELGFVSLRFNHMGSEWPMRWSLQSVRIYSDSEPSKEVRILNSDLRNLLSQSFRVNWLALQGRIPARTE